MKLSEKLRDEYIRVTESFEDLARHAELLERTLKDARSGLRYIRETYGELYGVGFDRVEENAKRALEE